MGNHLSQECSNIIEKFTAVTSAQLAFEMLSFQYKNIANQLDAYFDSCGNHLVLNYTITSVLPSKGPSLCQLEACATQTGPGGVSKARVLWSVVGWLWFVCVWGLVPGRPTSCPLWAGIPFVAHHEEFMCKILPHYCRGSQPGCWSPWKLGPLLLILKDFEIKAFSRKLDCDWLMF